MNASLQEALRPVVEPLALRYAGHKVQRLVGFWLCWHTMGGLDALLGSGVWSKSSVYGQMREFRKVFGTDVDGWMPYLITAVSTAVPPAVAAADASEVEQGHQLLIPA